MKILAKLLAGLALASAALPPAYATARKPLVIVSGQTKQLPSTDTLVVNAAASGNASINLPHGSAPSSPNNGDCWTTTGGLYCRINGSSIGPFTTGAGGGGGGGGVSGGDVTASGLTMNTAKILARTTASPGAIEEKSLSEVLDMIGSAAQGDILYRGSSSWARLAAGTSGYVLRSNGASNNPGWANVGAGGGGSTGLTPPTASLFSITLNSPTVTDYSLSMRIDGAIDASLIRGKFRALPAGDFTVTTHIMAASFGAQFNGAGIVFRDNAGTPKYSACFVHRNGNGWDVASENWSDNTTFASTNSGGLSDASADDYPHWIKAEFTASTNDFVCKFSWDGTDWITGATSSYLGTADAVGLALFNASVSNAASVWFDHWDVQ